LFFFGADSVFVVVVDEITSPPLDIALVASVVSVVAVKDVFVAVEVHSWSYLLLLQLSSSMRSLALAFDVMCLHCLPNLPHFKVA
jgi:hypothetical protein